MAEKNPTWIYRADGAAKVVDMGRGESPPEGWSCDPSVIADERLRTANALSGIRPPVVVDAGAKGVEPMSELNAAALAESPVRISELEGVIAAGTAENERLTTELNAAEDELEAAAREISDLRAQLQAKAETAPSAPAAAPPAPAKK